MGQDSSRPCDENLGKEVEGLGSKVMFLRLSRALYTLNIVSLSRVTKRVVTADWQALARHKKLDLD